ncbi:MAG: hypothetical protein AVDCRST_MAG30-2448, partial [uncultured Solirubrobacteraceae bacterium]
AHRHRHRLDAAPLLGPARGRRQAPPRGRSSVRDPADVGHPAAAARAAQGLHRRDAPRRLDPPGEAVPGRRGGRHRLARGRALHPHHLAPRRRGARRDGAVARLHRPALRRALLLVRQGLALPGDRHRRARRRLAGQPHPRARGGDRRRDAAAPLEPRSLRGGGRGVRRGLARARAQPRAGARRGASPARDRM